MPDDSDAILGRLAVGRGLLSREQVDNYLAELEEGESLLERLLTDEVIDEEQFGALQEAYEDYVSRQGEQTLTEGTDFEVEATAVRDRSGGTLSTRADDGDDVTMEDPDITPATFDAEGVTIDEWDATDTSGEGGGAPTTGSDDEDGGVGQLEGQIIGGCKISKKLGQGGMGAVYLADHLGLEKKVAIKVIAGAAASGDAAVQRFVREAKAAAKLAHPNIVGVFNVGRDKGFNFIEMEFIEGKSVRDMIADESLDLEESIRILRESCKGLSHAHQAGLVHRDIKPDNILVSNRGEVKIADFGLARSVEEESMEITRSGQILGTPHFMSPEQCDGAKTDQRTDVYSMGVTMYTMLSGEKPFLGETAMAVLMKHIHEEPPPLREKAPHVPEDLDHIVMRMMSKPLDDRYQSCDDVLADLDKWDGGGAIAAPKRRRKKSNKGLLVTMATLAVLAGGGAAAVMMGVVPGLGPGKSNGNGNGGQTGPVRPVRENPVVIAKRAIDNFDYAKAIGLLDEYLKKKPNDAEAVALLKTARFKDTTKTGREALDAGRYDAAIESFTAAMADAPSQSAKDELQQQIDKAQAAKDKAARTEAVQGGLTDANREVAAGNFAEALAAVNRVLQSDPENGVASILKGNIEQWAASAAALDNAATGLDRARKLLHEDEDPVAAVAVLSAAQAEMAKATQLDDPKRTLQERHDALAARLAELGKRRQFLHARNTAQEHFDAGRWAAAHQAFYDAAADAPDTSTKEQMEAQARQSNHRLADQLIAEGEALLAKELVAQAVKKFTTALNARPDPKLAARVTMLKERAATPEGMIYIPAGEYTPGSADSRDKNPEQPPVTLSGYYIAQTEVTNADYAAFVRAGGYTTEAHWDPEGWKLRERFTDKSGKPGPSTWVDGAPPPGEERHPVSGISWYEASAYAAWAKKRLPTEVEWERAACFDTRTNRKLIYPWGGEFAQGAAAVAGGADQTHPVGSHPKDRSPAGLLDVAGNAHEWTSSTTTRAGRTRHVARGGAVGAAEPEVLARLLQRRITPGAAFRQGPLGLRLAADPPGGGSGGGGGDDDGK